MQNNLYLKFIKRPLDLILTIPVLLILLPLFVFIAFIIKITAPGPVFFKQKRMGINFSQFDLYKFRSMIVNAPQAGPSVTAGNDPRITAIGRFLRKSKLDELPQLINVIKGEMSLVGPRPEVEKFVNAARTEYTRILTIRPGITDYAAIEFRDEETVMEKFSDKEKGYIEEVLPLKIALYQQYLDQIAFTTDLKIIFKTFYKIIR